MSARRGRPSESDTSDVLAYACQRFVFRTRNSQPTIGRSDYFISLRVTSMLALSREAAARRSPCTSQARSSLATISSTDFPPVLAACTPRGTRWLNSRVLREIRHRHLRAVAGDDRVDVLEAAVRLRERVADRDAAAAVVGVEERKVLAGEDVPGVHIAERREHDPGVAVRVSAAEVVKSIWSAPLPSVILSLKVRFGSPRPLFCLKMLRRLRPGGPSDGASASCSPSCSPARRRRPWPGTRRCR